MTCVNRFKFALAAGATVVLTAGAAVAQTSGSNSAAAFQSGWGNSRYSTAQSQSGTTRDANGNRLIVDGIIQSGASSYASRSSGVSTSGTWSGSNSNGSGTTIGGSTAIGNQLNVVVQGNHNTVIVNSRQTNNGNVTAGTVLNGTLNLND